MSSKGFELYDNTVRTARTWLADTMTELGTDDPHVAHRALRAWLHAVRDRMPVTAAARFAAQLPELLRGVFYEGWQPSRVPVKYGSSGYRVRFSGEAGVDVDQVETVSAAVVRALGRHVGMAEIAAVLALMPERLRDLMGAPLSGPVITPGPADIFEPEPAPDDEIGVLRERVDVLSRALGALVEDLPPDGGAEVSTGARRARDILTAAAL